MKIGFGKGRLTDAFDLTVRSKAAPAPAGEDRFRLEKKFDVTDRVKGLWRPDEAGERRIEDDLYVQAMAGADGNGPWAVLCFDTPGFPHHMVDAIREPLVREFGYRPERVLFLPTHCHMTVRYHPDKLRQVIIHAVREALERSVEAEMAAMTLSIDANRYVINRRVHIKGVGTRTVMFNDYCEGRKDHLVVTDQIRDWIGNLGGRLEDFVEPGMPVVTHGEVNPLLQTVFLRDAGAKAMLGTFTVFAAHPVIASEKKVNGDISADYPGYLRQRLEEKLGGIALFAQGASGDLRPLMREYSHAMAREYGHALADKIIEATEKGLAWEKLDWITYDSEPVPLPLRHDMPGDGKSRARELARIEAAYDRETSIEERRRLQNRFWFFLRSDAIRGVLRPEWVESGTLPVSLYALRLNDTVILACHGEIFNATRKAMIAPFAAVNPLVTPNCNETITYLPSLDDFEKGGYEPSVCVAEPGSTDLYVSGAARLIKRILER